MTFYASSSQRHIQWAHCPAPIASTSNSIILQQSSDASRPFLTRERLDFDRVSRLNPPSQSPRPVKRRMTTEPTPTASRTSTNSRSQSFTAGAPTTGSSAMTFPIDPLPGQPGVTIIRTPLPPHINYMFLHNNPSIFLDPSDFLGLYPVNLEPPRGMCCKERLPAIDPAALPQPSPPPDTNPYKSEDKLRCPFCRRSYGGSNGRSMWRRHVWDKHKVGMSNRREVTRSSSSNDENAGRPAKKARIEPSVAADESKAALNFSQSQNLPKSNAEFAVKTAKPDRKINTTPITRAADEFAPPLLVPLRPQTPPPSELPIPPPTPHSADMDPQWVHAPPEQPQCLRFPSPEHPLHSGIWTSLCEDEELRPWPQHFLSAPEKSETTPDDHPVLIPSPVILPTSTPSRNLGLSPPRDFITPVAFSLSKATWREDSYSPSMFSPPLHPLIILSPSPSTRHSRRSSDELTGLLEMNSSGSTISLGLWAESEVEAVVVAGPNFSPGGHLLPALDPSPLRLSKTKDENHIRPSDWA